jgi:hypothetical protein
MFGRRTNGTQKIFFIENQKVTIPAPGTKAPTIVGVFAFQKRGKQSLDECKNLSAEGAGAFK